MSNLKVYEKRRYQEKAVEAFQRWMSDKNGQRIATIILPTGAGKSYSCALCLETIPNLKILWVAHREELIQQAHEAITSIINGRKISIEMSKQRAEASDEIIIGSVQTISRNRKNLEGFIPDLIVIDEYHHYSETNTQYHGLLERWPDAKILGLTATPWRFSGEVLPLGEVLIQMDIGQAVEKGYLVKPRAEILNTNISLAQVGTRMGDFDPAALSKAINVDSRNQLIAQKIISLVKEEKRQGILFAVDVAHSKAMYQLLKDQVRAVELYGDTESKERTESVAKIRNQEVDIILNNLICLDLETEILTRSGWVGKDQITEEHEVANWEDGKIWFAKPSRIVKRPRAINEKMVCLETNNQSIRVTENHKLIYKEQLADSWIKDEAINLCGKNIFLPVSGHADSSAFESALSLEECKSLGIILGGNQNTEALLNIVYSNLLCDLNQDQFDSLIDGVYSVQHRFNSIESDCVWIVSENSKFIDMAQAVATCRGYSSYIINTDTPSSFYLLMMTKALHIQTADYLEIESEWEVESWKEEEVWCVTTESGNIITRRHGKVTVMGNCVEGTDFPHLSFVVMARPTRSLGLWCQAVGRGLRKFPDKEDCIIVDVYDKLKAKQSRVTFKELEVAGDLSGDKKRAASILTTEVKLDEVAHTLTHFPIFIKPEKMDRWPTDEESLSISSWSLAAGQWFISWSAEIKSQKQIQKSLWVPFDSLPPDKISLVGKAVKHETFGEGKIKSIAESGDNPKILVTFDWGTDRVILMKSLKRVGYITEDVPDQFEIKKVERLFYLCLPNPESLGRLLSFERQGQQLLLKADQRVDKAQAEALLEQQAMEDGVLQLVKASARWKSQPASDKQLDLIERLVSQGRIGFDLDLDSLTKGEVSAIIEQSRWQTIISQRFGATVREKLLGYDLNKEDL